MPPLVPSTQFPRCFSHGIPRGAAGARGLLHGPRGDPVEQRAHRGSHPALRPGGGKREKEKEGERERERGREKRKNMMFLRTRSDMHSGRTEVTSR